MEPQQKNITIDIGWSTLFRLLVVFVGIWAIISLKDIFIMLFIVFMFVGAITPTVNKFQQWMSRTLAVILVYFIILLLFAAISYLLFPPLAQQLADLGRTLPGIVEQVRAMISPSADSRYSSVIEQLIGNLSGGLKSISGNMLNFVIGLFGGLATFFTGLVLSFYLLLEEKNAKEFFNQVFPKSRFEAVYTTVIKISDRMGSWARGELILMAWIFVANLILFFIAGVSYPIPLALWAGLCEIIPYVGPLLGTIPAIIVLLVAGKYGTAIVVFIISFFVIQQIQGHLVVPKVMSKAVGLSPVLVILSLVIGAKLYGLVGALIAIPAAAVISVIVGEWSHLRMIWSKQAPED